jgi:hypothetical protein
MKGFHSYHVTGLALALGSALQAATYEVAQQNLHASDDGPGTLERPWKTIAKAAEKASPGDVVVIRAGVYRERVLAKTSGTAQAPVRFEAALGTTTTSSATISSSSIAKHRYGAGST